MCARPYKMTDFGIRACAECGIHESFIWSSCIDTLWRKYNESEENTLLFSNKFPKQYETDTVNLVSKK